MLARMLGAARLNVDTYEDVEKDKGATIQAMIVVILVAISAGVGGCAERRRRPGQGTGFRRYTGSVVLGRLGTGGVDCRHYFVEDPGDRGRLGPIGSGHWFRPNSRGLLNVFVFVTGSRDGHRSGGRSSGSWSCMVVAVRQSLDYTSTLRAIFVIVIALIPVVIINAILFAVLGIGVQTPEVAVEGAKSLLTIVQTYAMAG